MPLRRAKASKPSRDTQSPRAPVPQGAGAFAWKADKDAAGLGHRIAGCREIDFFTRVGSKGSFAADPSRPGVSSSRMEGTGGRCVAASAEGVACRRSLDHRRQLRRQHGFAPRPRRHRHPARLSHAAMPVACLEAHRLAQWKGEARSCAGMPRASRSAVSALHRDLSPGKNACSRASTCAVSGKSGSYSTTGRGRSLSRRSRLS